MVETGSRTGSVSTSCHILALLTIIACQHDNNVYSYNSDRLHHHHHGELLTGTVLTTDSICYHCTQLIQTGGIERTKSISVMKH